MGRNNRKNLAWLHALMQNALDRTSAAAAAGATPERGGKGPVAIRHLMRSNAMLSGRALAFVVFASSIALTLAASEYARRNAAHQLEDRFLSVSSDISDDVRAQMTAVEESLYASRSYLVASKTIDRENWLAFQASQRLETFHPATLGIGLALEVSEADKTVYVSAIRRREQPDFTIWPSGDRPIYVPIRFAASHNGDRRALGFDMFAEPRRRAAMERARDTGEPSLSGVVTLVKAGAMENQQSVILFLPLYKHPLSAGATIEQRRAAIQGYVYCPILIPPFWQNIIDKAAYSHLAMRITDGYGSTVLSTYSQARAREGESPSVRVSTSAYGQPWLTEYEALSGFAPTPFGSPVRFVALTGTLISFLLTALVWTLVSTRRRAETIAGEMTNRLRESENLFRTLWETTTDAIVLLDDQGRIRYANPALRDIFGHEPAEITGKNISVLQPEALRAGHQAGFSRFLRTGKRRLDWRSIETRGLHRQGHEFSIEISFSQLEVEGRPGFASFMRDITERKRAHQAVRESEQRLNFALEAAGIGDWDMDLRTNTTRRSLRHDQCFGYSEPVSDWGYDTFLAHVHPADRDRVDAAYQKALSGGEIYDEEFRVTWPDGSLHWLWSKGRFYRDDSGRPYRVAGIEVDITERKRIEVLVRENSERLALALQVSDIGLWEWRPDTNEVFFSAQWKRQLGYADAEIANRFEEWQNRVHPDDLRTVLPRIQAYLANLEADAIEMEFRMRHKDGSWRWIFSRGQTERDEHGKAVRMLGCHVNITARKQADQALRESEENYRRLVNLSPDAVTVHQDGKWVFANAATARILGVATPAQLIGKPLLQFMHPDTHDMAIARMNRLYDGGLPIEVAELPMVRADGGIVFLETHAVPIVWQGRPAAQVVAHDITERKRAEEALAEYSQRLQAMSRQLLEVQEHERHSLARELHDTVGQELSALGMNLAMIRRALPQALAQHLVDRFDDSEVLIEVASGRLRNIMADLRPPGIDELGFMTVLNEHARTVAKRSELKLTVQGTEPRQRFVPATAIALFRIAQEALNNSVKHAQASAIGIELRDEPDVVRLTLYDNGRGFDAGRKRALGAYGMGMTTMRERAEAIGARLSIDAAPGRGTRISVEIPRAVATGAPAQQKSES